MHLPEFIVGALGASLGSLGLPPGVFGDQFGCLRGSIRVPLVPSGLPKSSKIITWARPGGRIQKGTQN